ncbi:MAG: hypothetical protein WCO47_05965 [Methylococcus sp.]|jgi:hypothetical protein
MNMMAASNQTLALIFRMLVLALALSSASAHAYDNSFNLNHDHLLYGAERRSPQLSSAQNKQVAYLQALASVGPSKYLSEATVTLKDSTGKVISRGRTNTRGSTMFYLTADKLGHQPFKLVTSGGKIIGQNGDQSNGPVFGGHLKAQILNVHEKQHSMVYIDLLSTGASSMESDSRSYERSIEMVRAALGIGKGFPNKGLRYTNNHVGWQQLESAYKKSGGYDLYIKRLVRRINKQQKISELTPLPTTTRVKPSLSANAEVINNALRTSGPMVALEPLATATNTSPQCTAPLGNGSGNSISTEIIEDFGVLGVQNLMQYAGIQSTASGGLPTVIDEVGMLLTGGGAGSTTTAQLSEVEEQLNCIGAQLSYLQEQVNELQLTEDIQSDTACSSAVTNAYDQYESLVYNASPYGSTAPSGVTMTSVCYPQQQSGASSVCPLNATNSALITDLGIWNPSNTMTVSDCGGTVGTNNMLFGTAGGQGSAWQQLNKNYQSTSGGYSWYTALQVQQLQQFLSYWGSIEYYLFTLNNEYLNYCGNTSSYSQSSCSTTTICTWTCPSSTASATDVNTLITAAANGYIETAQANSGSVSGSQTVCQTGTLSTSASYCAAQSNIANAYPPDLYSDEIGIWNNTTGTGAGLAINPYPAGLAMSNSSPSGQLGLNPAMIFNVSGENSSWSANAAASGASNFGKLNEAATTASYTQFNGYANNPAGLPSAIEQFSNPQALRTLQPTSTQIASLTSGNYSQGSSGLTSWQFFVNAINQTAPSGYSFPIASGWKNLTASSSTSNGTGFFASNNVSELQVYYQDATSCNGGTSECITTNDTFNNSIGPYHFQFTTHGTSHSAGGPDNYPIFGALLGRTWWTAYSSNNPPISYVPPQPCTPNSSTYVATTSTTAAYCSQ